MFTIFKTKSGKDDIPKTTRNQAMPMGKHLAEYAEKRTQKDLETYHQSAEYKALIAKRRK